MEHFFSHRFSKTIAGALLTSILLSSFAFVLVPRPAMAQQSVFDPTNFVVNTMTSVESKVSAVMNSLSAATLKTLGLKEWTLDGVLFALAKKALQQMVRSTIDWINSGFKGSPMYVTDPAQFFMNTADEVAGQIIYSSKLSFLCSPTDMRIALDFYYRQSRYASPQCTLTGITRNVNSFINNADFLSGGWPGWLAVSITPTDQPAGGVIAGAIRIEGGIAAALGYKRDELSWGKGFLSYKECVTPDNCKIVTPGSTIADALTFQLSSGQMTLIEADEINELIGALFAQLGKEALTSLRGVSGLSQSGSTYSFGSSYAGSGGYGSTTVPFYCDGLTYLEQLDDPRCNPNFGGNATTTATSTLPGDISFISDALNAERDYEFLYRSLISRADSVVKEATDSDLTCQQNRSIAASAEEILKDAEREVASSTALTQRLRNIETHYRQASGAAQLDAVNEFIALQGSGALHSEVDTALETRKTDELKEDLDDLRNRIKRCEPPPDDTNDTDV